MGTQKNETVINVDGILTVFLAIDMYGRQCLNHGSYTGQSICLFFTISAS